MGEFEKQEKRIMTILGTKKLDVTRKTLCAYLKYLKNHVEIPCQLTGIEDFEWEEPYVFGFGSKREYQELKKTQPSYTDKFNLIDFIGEIDDEQGEHQKVLGSHLQFDETEEVGLQTTQTQSAGYRQGGIKGKGDRTDRNCPEAGTRQASSQECKVELYC